MTVRTILRPDRRLIRMFGRNPVNMIQGLATNDVAGAPVDTSVYTVFLTPKGKLIGDARVVRRANGDVWIEAEEMAAANIAETLKKTVPPLFSRWEYLEDHVVMDVVGGELTEAAPELVLTNPFRSDVLSYVFNREATEITENSITKAEMEVLRIEAGEPKWGAELTEEVIPLEAGLRGVAISESKGCYTGQEVIIRILHRGHVNRHLRGIMMGKANMPAVGAEISDPNGKVVGKVTSATYSPRLEQAIGLAYVRREIEPPASLVIDGERVDVVALPFETAGVGA